MKAKANIFGLFSFYMETIQNHCRVAVVSRRWQGRLVLLQGVGWEHVFKCKMWVSLLGNSCSSFVQNSFRSVFTGLNWWDWD